jgi:NAD(P)H-nitrite reductase large subunit
VNPGYSTTNISGILGNMGQNRKGRDNRERIVCFCYSVPESVIVDAIRGGCLSLMDIRRETYASTGCAGCSEEVKKLLRKHAHEAASAPAAADEPGGEEPGGFGYD